MRENDSSKIEKMNNICINVFGYEGRLLFPIYVSKPKFEDLMDLLLVREVTSHIMCILKILADLCFTKHRVKTKNGFVKAVYSVLVVKMC